MDDLLADVVADGEEKNQVAVDTQKLCFVNGSKVSRRIEEVCRGRCEGWRDKIHAGTVEESSDMGSLIKSARVVWMPGEADTTDACGVIIEFNWSVARD